MASKWLCDSLGSVDGTTLGLYCGTKYSPGWDAFTSIISTESNITVIFETDDSVTDFGFLANYKIGKCDFGGLYTNRAIEFLIQFSKKFSQ